MTKFRNDWVKVADFLIIGIIAPKPNGSTPIILAAYRGHVKIVEFLAPLVDNPNAPKPDGWTPLHLAARYGHVKIIEFLAPLVDKPNAPKPNGWTPLQLAVEGGHSEVVITLFKILSQKIPLNEHILKHLLNTLRR